jgi:hypothetical protein
MHLTIIYICISFISPLRESCLLAALHIFHIRNQTVIRSSSELLIARKLTIVARFLDPGHQE